MWSCTFYNVLTYLSTIWGIIKEKDVLLTPRSDQTLFSLILQGQFLTFSCCAALYYLCLPLTLARWFYLDKKLKYLIYILATKKKICSCVFLKNKLLFRHIGSCILTWQSRIWVSEGKILKWVYFYIMDCCTAKHCMTDPLTYSDVIGENNIFIKLSW